MMKRCYTFLCIALFVAALWSCEKEERSSDNHVTTYSAVVLNEGNMGSNNAALSALDILTGAIDNAWFQHINGRKLGDQAQDMVAYGSKIYVTVTESNTLEAIDPVTGVSVQRSMGSLKPRSIAAHGGKLYITCYNPPCVVRVDATTLAIEDTCLLGDYRPEGIAIAQGKAFVAGAYHKSDYNRLDNRVYVVDLTVFDTLPAIMAGSNNIHLERIDANTLIVGHGNGTEASPNGAFILDATTYAVTTVAGGLTKMAVSGGQVYGFDAPYGGTPTFKVVHADGSVAAFPFTPQFETLEQDENPYGIAVNPDNGDIYITTDGAYRVPGDIYCFRSDGSLRYKVEGGMFPSKILFLTE